MITNSLSESRATRKLSFKILTAVITAMFICSVTFTTFATTNSVNKVTVTDGEKSVSISTAETDPYAIVKAAGFELEISDEIITKDFSAEDGGTIVIRNSEPGDIFNAKNFKIDFADEIKSAKNVFENINIHVRKAFRVNISSDGKNQKVFLAKGTVSDALDKAGITLGENDLVFPSLDTKLNGFTKIRVFRVKYDVKSEIQEIPYETEIIKDNNMFVDESEIITEGVNGKRYAFYTEKYVDGKLEETVFSREKVVEEPVNEVKKVGTKHRATLSAFKNTGAPISELEVPSNLKLDKNGVPVDYKYCISGKATAYTGDPETSTGRKPMPGHIAVNPKEIPYGTELYVVSADGDYVYGYCIAADTGGFVKMGNTDIDLYMDNSDMCYDWGNRNVKIYVLS